jgi:hypothetical protein
MEAITRGMTNAIRRMYDPQLNRTEWGLEFREEATNGIIGSKGFSKEIGSIHGRDDG